MTGIKGKQGQFYIFIAILLIVSAFAITRPAPLLQEKRDAFKELYQNFITESAVAVNSALYDDSNVSERYQTFADEYADYAKTKSPKFGFMYILRDGNVMVVGNKLGLSVNLSFTKSTVNVDSDALHTTTPQNLSIIVDDTQYDFDIVSDQYQAQTLFRQKKGDEIRFFVS